MAKRKNKKRLMMDIEDITLAQQADYIFNRLKDVFPLFNRGSHPERVLLAHVQDSCLMWIIEYKNGNGLRYVCHAREWTTELQNFQRDETGRMELWTEEAQSKVYDLLQEYTWEPGVAFTIYTYQPAYKYWGAWEGWDD